jgi:hypothetical protein
MAATLDHPRVSPMNGMADAIRCINAGLVPFIQSSPGIGKSSLAKEIAAKGNLQLIDLRLSQCAPEDLQGLPMKEMINGQMKSVFLPFDTFPLSTDPLPPGKSGWLLFLDEFNSATKATQAAAYKLVLDRLVGNHALHPACAVMAAGNLATDKAIVTSMSTAMQSRLVHIILQVSHSEWIEWANKKDIDYRVIGFMHFQPAKLHNFQPEHQDMTFPCPRTWEFTSALVKGVSDLIPLRAVLSGAIGPGAAMEFVAFSEEFARIPSLNTIINDPNNTNIPKELSTRWAILTMLSANTDHGNAKHVIKYITRFRPEEQIIYYRAISSRDHTIRSVPEVSAELVKVMRFMHNV